MDMSQLIPLHPTMEVLCEDLSHLGWQCDAHIPNLSQHYRSVRLYTGTQIPEPDIVYALRPGETGFPTDDYAYICVTPIPGKANHLYLPRQSAEDVLDALMELFCRYQAQENKINQLTYQSGSLDELCELASILLENPVYIHDDWFIMIGMSASARNIMTPEYLMSSSVGFVPRVILEDFKYDTEYLATYAHHDAQIWRSEGTFPDTLYVNLLEGNVYRGRFLVLQHNRPFHKWDFVLAYALTQRAILLLQKRLQESLPRHRSMDNTVLALLEGHPTNPADLSHLLEALKWNPFDSYLCVRIKSQKAERNTVMEHQLHSDLFRLFPNSYILLLGQEQCVILNMTQNSLYPMQLRHLLSPLCLDYYLYAGVSSSVGSVFELFHAYFQAGVALDQTFQLRSDRWVLFFSDCTLGYLLSNLPEPLTPQQLIAPELNILIRYDQENGTQYFDTFREYLLCERDIPKTSEKLIIHRTTLLYRLKKIQSLISCNLEDPWLRLNLTLSLWILRMGQKQIDL